MTLVNREVLTREMRSVVAGSRELTTLQRAIDLLNPGHPRPDVTDVITAVLYSALRSHEDHTRAVLTRMNEAIARTLDDLDALRLGEAIGGRTATMRGNDLAVVAMAMDDLSTLEHHIRDLLQTDPDGSWVHGLRAEAEAAMTPSAQSIGAAAAAAARIPGNIGEALTGLRDAIHGVAPSGRSVWATARGAGGARELPEAIRTAAHNLVVLAGGDIGTAVRRALTTGGDAADDMVIAVLWAEGRIAPHTSDLGTRGFDIHQEMVTGLPFEWSGLRPSSTGSGARVRDIGIDGIAGGLVVDAKHVAGSFEDSAHLLGGAEATSRRRSEMFTPTLEGESPHYPSERELRPFDAVDELDQMTRSTATGERARIEGALTDQEIEIMSQMRRQLQFARDNGLRGIHWVTNSAEAAAHLEQLMARLDANFSDMVRRVEVGGLRGGG